MASAASSLPAPSSAAAVASFASDCELLQLLEEFSTDDIADVVRAIDVSESELLAPASSSSSSLRAPLISDINNSTAASSGTVASALTVVGQRSAVSAHHANHNKKAKAAATGDRSKPKPKRRNDPNKARNQRKEELIYLHKKVAELEKQLGEMERNVTTTEITALQMGANASTSQASGGTQINSTSELSLVVPSKKTVAKRAPSLAGSASSAAASAARVWEELAERQRTLRVQSERENIRLKLVLETQLKIARSLEKVLLKPASTREVEKSILGTSYSPSGPTSIVSQSVPDRLDAAIFDELLAGVQQSYAEIDAVFEANGLARMETTHKDARMRRDANGNVVMEIFANKVLPFGIHETGDAVWHHFVFGKEKVPNRLHTENAPKVFLPSISSYLKNFGLEIHAQHKSANFRVKQVLQQHVEGEERVVIVWQALIDPVAFSDDPLLPNDVGFIEKGYIVMKRPPSMPGDLTLLQTCHIIAPNLRRRTAAGGTSSSCESDEDGFARVGALTDFVLSATAANISTSYQIIENVLLEQSLRKKKRSGDGSGSE